MLDDLRLVAQFVGFGHGDVGNGLKVGVGMAGRDDHDQALGFLGKAGGRAEDHQHRQYQYKDLFHRGFLLRFFGTTGSVPASMITHLVNKVNTINEIKFNYIALLVYKEPRNLIKFHLL